MNQKMLLLKTVANGFYKLHSSGIVHFDVKPANILVKRSANGNYTAKLIDFDAGFFIGEDIENSELGGDLTYLAPETFLGMYGEDVRINEKADIFALGLVFHQYCTGILPSYNKEEYAYPYESVLDDAPLSVDLRDCPSSLQDLIVSMLDVDPNKRPSAGDVFNKLNEITGTVVTLEAQTVYNTGFVTSYGTARGGAVSGSRLRSTMRSSRPATEGESIGDPVKTLAPGSAGYGVPSTPMPTSSPWFKSAGDL